MICLTKNDFGIIQILNNALFAHIDVTPFGPMRYVHENRPSGAVGQNTGTSLSDLAIPKLAKALSRIRYKA